MNDAREKLGALLREVPPDQLADVLATLSARERAIVADLWEVTARPEQIWRPTHHTITLYLAGRGWGKTATGAEATHYVAAHPELCGGVIGIVGRTANDVRQTILYGPSGIMSCAEWRRPRHWKADMILEWPNGVIARLFSAEKPESMRGPNIGWLWGDEVAHWQRDEEMADQIDLALRLGDSPRAVYTTTPLGTPLLARLAYVIDRETQQPVPDPDAPDGYAENPDTRIVRGHTRDNAAHLGRGFVDRLEARLGGTRLGQQELEGRILLDSPRAIWRRQWIRRCTPSQVPALARVVVAVDPSGSTRSSAAEVGIVVAGVSRSGDVYVLADASGSYSPREWSTRAVALARQYQASIVAERNYGGDMVRETLQRVPGAHLTRIEDAQATRSKRERWSVAALPYEQGRAYHVSKGTGDTSGTTVLEHQMTTTDPDGDGRKDRADALAWAIIALTQDEHAARAASVWTDANLWR